MDAIRGLAGKLRPVDPATGIVYQTEVGGQPMRGWYGGILSIADGILYDGDRPAFGLSRSGQMMRALPVDWGPPLPYPPGQAEDFSPYLVTALIGYRPELQRAQPIGVSARDSDMLSIANQAQPGGAFEEDFRAAGWSGNAVDALMQGSGPETYYDYATAPAFEAWARSRRVRMIEEDFGFMRGQYTLFIDGLPVAQYQFAPSAFDSFMSRAVEVVGTAILTTATAGALGPVVAAVGLPSSVAAGLTQAGASAIVAAGTDRPVTVEGFITSALLSAGRAELGSMLGATEGAELVPFDELEEATDAATIDLTPVDVIDAAIEGGTNVDDFYDFGDAALPWEPSDLAPWEPVVTMPFEPPVIDEGEFLAPIQTPVPDLGGEIIDLPPPPMLIAPPPPLVPIPEVVISRPSIPTGTEWSVERVIKVVTGAASSAIGLVKAWEQRKLPPNTTARVTDPSGRTIVAKGDGMIYTRAPDGKITTSKPAVGLPQSTLDGYVVVNNGDGTFTRISPSGGREVLSYPDTLRKTPAIGGADGSGTGLLVLAGIAAVALLS